MKSSFKRGPFRGRNEAFLPQKFNYYLWFHTSWRLLSFSKAPNFLISRLVEKWIHLGKWKKAKARKRKPDSGNFKLRVHSSKPVLSCFDGFPFRSESFPKNWFQTRLSDFEMLVNFIYFLHLKMLMTASLKCVDCQFKMQSLTTLYWNQLYRLQYDTVNQKRYFFINIDQVFTFFRFGLFTRKMTSKIRFFGDR